MLLSGRRMQGRIQDFYYHYHYYYYFFFLGGGTKDHEREARSPTIRARLRVMEALGFLMLCRVI